MGVQLLAEPAAFRRRVDTIVYSALTLHRRGQIVCEKGKKEERKEKRVGKPLQNKRSLNVQIQTPRSTSATHTKKKRKGGGEEKKRDAKTTKFFKRQYTCEGRKGKKKEDKIFTETQSLKKKKVPVLYKDDTLNCAETEREGEGGEQSCFFNSNNENTLICPNLKKKKKKKSEYGKTAYVKKGLYIYLYIVQQASVTVEGGGLR